MFLFCKTKERSREDCISIYLLMTLSGMILLMLGGAMILTNCFDGVKPCKSSVATSAMINNVDYIPYDCSLSYQPECTRSERICTRHNSRYNSCNNICFEYKYHQCYDVSINLTIPANVTESFNFTCIIQEKIQNSSLTKTMEFFNTTHSMTVHVIGEKCYNTEIKYNNDVTKGFIMIVIGASFLLFPIVIALLLAIFSCLVCFGYPCGYEKKLIELNNWV